MDADSPALPEHNICNTRKPPAVQKVHASHGDSYVCGVQFTLSVFVMGKHPSKPHRHSFSTGVSGYMMGLWLLLESLARPCIPLSGLSCAVGRIGEA